MSIPIDNVGNMMNSNYMTAVNNKTSSLEETLNSDLSKATDDELMDVCKDFEAYFVEQMFKAMQKMVPESEDEQSASTKQLQDYYKDEMIKSMSESSAENGGLGLAQTLYEQMKRNYNL
ncbi:MAG: hypothetical protein HFI76_00260 [Lachnospiraceae bacterium]|nr:hypothetical protein [Lachnospiraceae bacterium]